MKRLLLACTLLIGGSAFAVEIIAHRGASYDAPENTLASFKLGFQQKADAVECDIWLTKDGKIVVMHDGNTARTTGQTNKIANTSLAKLRKLDAAKWGQWPEKGFSEKIPTLAEVLPLIPDNRRLVIEIKCGPEIVPELNRVLKASGKKSEQFILISFNYESAKAAKLEMPAIPVLFLKGPDKKEGQKTYVSVESLIEKAKAANLDGLDLEWGFPIDKEFVAKVRKAGLKLYTWTVDDPAEARKEAAAGVDGITTNRPGWLREQLAANALP